MGDAMVSVSSTKDVIQLLSFRCCRTLPVIMPFIFLQSVRIVFVTMRPIPPNLVFRRNDEYAGIFKSYRDLNGLDELGEDYVLLILRVLN